MKDAALVQVGIAAWQTPRNGDFARYVEQLTGGRARVTLDEPGRVRRMSERTAALASPSSTAARVLAQMPPGPAAEMGTASDAAAMRGSVASVLAKMRWGLMLLTLVQLGFLAILSLGSFVGVGASLVLWWLLGRVTQVVHGVGASQNRSSEVLAEARRELLSRAAEQRKKERRT